MANGWGGRREGAGRPPTKWIVPHVSRPHQRAGGLVRILLTAAPGVPSLRQKKVASAIFARLRRLEDADYFAERRRTFSVEHVSIRAKKLLFIVRSSSSDAMSRGMQGLLAWIVRDVNDALERSGKLFTERFRSTILATPKALREAVSELEADGLLAPASA